MEVSFSISGRKHWENGLKQWEEAYQAAAERAWCFLSEARSRRSTTPIGHISRNVSYEIEKEDGVEKMRMMTVAPVPVSSQ